MQTMSINNSVTFEPVNGVFKLRFDDDVIHPSYYRNEVQALQMARPEDLVEITVNSDGGSLATGIEMVNEILTCKAKDVKGVLRANSHSCGSIVFLACNSHEVGLASEMLLHSGSGGTGGTPTQSIQRANSYKRQVRALFETVYKGFLSDEELDNMIEKDEEFIFGSEEISERLERMYTYRENQVTNFFEEMDHQSEELNDRMVSAVLDKLKLTPKERSVFEKVKANLEGYINSDGFDPESLLSVEDTSEENTVEQSCEEDIPKEKDLMKLTKKELVSMILDMYK